MVEEMASKSLDKSIMEKRKKRTRSRPKGYNAVTWDRSAAMKKKEIGEKEKLMESLQEFMVAREASMNSGKNGDAKIP